MKRFYILICAVLLAGGSLSAQEAEKSGADSLNVRLSKIEKRTAVLEKVRQYVKLSAFMQGEYDWIDSGKDGETTGTSSR